MYLAAHFWMGTKEEWDESIHHNYAIFFVSRLAVTLLIGSVFFLLSLLLNWIFRKNITYKTLNSIVEYLLIVCIAILFNVLAVSE